MSIDDIKKWTELKPSELEIVYDPLDDFLRMGHALRTAVEELDGLRIGLCEMGEYEKAMATRNQLDCIRETLGIEKEENHER